MSTASEAMVLLSTEDGIATLTLNRPQARNALSVAMMTEIEAALDRLAGDASVKVVVLAANGPAFAPATTSRKCARCKGVSRWRRCSPNARA